MILVDVNLLIYATNADSPDHRAAGAWLESTLSGTDRVGLPWATILAFVRLSANPNVMRNPTTTTEAWRRVEQEWLSRQNVWIPEPGDAHPRILRFLFPKFAANWQRVSDAHLAALALEYGLTLCSTDAAFGNIPGLSVRNPLRQNTLHERAPLDWLKLREAPGEWHGNPLEPAVYSRPKTGKPSSRKPRR